METDMTDQLRGDEKFVMDSNSMAMRFSGMWRCGEDPPDAYLSVNNREVAVEISILMQSRFDGRGGTVSLLSDAMPPTQLGNELNNELQGKIPHGRGVILGRVDVHLVFGDSHRLANQIQGLKLIWRQVLARRI